MTTGLPDFFQYNLWANLRLLDACAPLSDAHLDGGSYQAPVIVVVIHAVNHAIDHRWQIATQLGQQDIEPPDLDGWSYHDAMLL
jgi:uncharacterized damage-inducible protein DinB